MDTTSSLFMLTGQTDSNNTPMGYTLLEEKVLSALRIWNP